MEDEPSLNRPPDLYSKSLSPSPTPSPANDTASNETASVGTTLLEIPPPPGGEDDPAAVPVEKKLTRRQRRKLKRSRRTMQDKATRTTWRSFIIMLLPLIGVAITYYYYSTDEPKMKILISAGVTVAVILLLAPLILWGAISSIRRGTRRMLLSLIMGFYSGILTVLLIAAITGGIIGYGIVTGEPIPIIDQQVELPGNLR